MHPIITIGANIHTKNIQLPIININSSNINPMRIKNVLIIAPMILENILDTNASAYLFRLNPLPYDQAYFLQGEKYVFNSNGIEKK
jgi:hypothetical protein